ncbi:hypothetical protein, partial [Neisseria sicca]|uniref:hypothetical protein n=1 Tax=Neisseria sicca TaxID=490 RepID=UPI001C9A16CD
GRGVGRVVWGRRDEMVNRGRVMMMFLRGGVRGLWKWRRGGGMWIRWGLRGWEGMEMGRIWMGGRGG